MSGNVSLYNESKATGGGSAILPTPAIGGVGLLDNWSCSATMAFKDGAQKIRLIGADAKAHPEIGRSLWLDVCHGRREGVPPRVNLEAERRNGEFVRMLIDEGHVTAVHDVSDGGILVAVTEMALAGNVGARLMVEAFEDKVDREKYRHAWSMFGETQGRYIVTEALDRDIVGKLARKAGVGSCFLGWTGGYTIYMGNSQVATDGEVSLADIRAAHEGFFPGLMRGELGMG